MTAIALTLIVVGAALAFATVAYRRLRSHRRGVGFRDYVKNPSSQNWLTAELAYRDSIRVPPDLPDSDIQRMVERLYLLEDKDYNLHRLKLVGHRAVPWLVKALNDPKTSVLRFTQANFSPGGISPFERICDALRPLGSGDAASALAPYIGHADSHFRQLAALAIGNIGSSDCIAAILRALGDEDDYVRSYAMMGIDDALAAGRRNPVFLDAVVPPLIKLLTREDMSASGRLPAILLAIDATKAMAILLAPEYFSVSNGELAFILEAFNEAKVAIPDERLLGLLRELEPLAMEYPHDREYAAALLAYGRHPDEAAEALFRAQLSSPNETVASAAAEALTVLCGIGDPLKSVFAAMEGSDRKVTQAQELYFAVYIYDAEVGNGGHAQFFVNGSGDIWRESRMGLQAMGAHERAKILQTAALLFGPNGPSEDHEQRRLQLARVYQRHEKELDECDKSYYSCKENMKQLMLLFAVANRDQFMD
jgi:HEAT repeat protein